MTPRVYLAGPINGRTDAECNDWRAEAKRLLAPLETLDPMARDYRGRENLPGIAREIVEGDKFDIRLSAALLVYFRSPSVGTSMEVMYAWQIEQRPFVVIVNVSGKAPSPWLAYHATMVVENLSDACTFLRNRLGLPCNSSSAPTNPTGSVA